MKRKNAIIISALVNATLLLVLFVGSTTRKEELSQDKYSAILEKDVIDAKSLYSSVESVDDEFEKQFNASISNVEEESKIDSIVHKLPEVELKEEKIAFEEITVQSGDTLEKIAKKNSVSLKELTELNELSSSFLKINQKLKLPQNKIKQEEAKKESYYVVKVGDNPYTIALKHSIKLSDLLKLNDLDEVKARKLKPGDKLKVK